MIETIFKNNAPYLIEAGHYYSSWGPTIMTELGLQIATQIPPVFGDLPQIMQFVDDIHESKVLGEKEREYQPIQEPMYPIEPDITFLESTAANYAPYILDAVLRETMNPDGKPALSKKLRATANGSGIHMSDFHLTNSEGTPSCVLLDAGLTFWKAVHNGAKGCINVLPHWYEGEQQQLHELTTRAFSVMSEDFPELTGFQLITILFDEDGNYWVMQPDGKKSKVAWSEFVNTLS